MRLKALFLLIVVALVAVPVSAQLVGRTVTVALLPACNGPSNMALVTDATNSTTLGAGGGSANVWVSCATGSWAIEEVAAVSDLTGYLETSGTKAAQISIEATGAGNDVSLVAADDVILTPADALTVAAGGAAAITTTAGAITLTAGGTTEDASVISTDDIFLTPDDALVAIAGGATTITSTAGTVAIASSAGSVTVTAVGATQDVTLTAADDVILAPTDALTGTVGGAVAITTTAGDIGFVVGGTTQDFTVSSVDDATFTITDDVVFTVQDFLPSASATAVIVAPATTITASTSVLMTTPKASVSGVIEHKVTNVTVADDAGGTKPTGAIPVTTDYATCTCNDATGCTMSIAEPTVTVGYGRLLVIASVGTGNCEFADSAGVTEIGAALVLEPTSTATYAYLNAAWHLIATTDNVP
jgi:hypothetical protein